MEKSPGEDGSSYTLVFKPEVFTLSTPLDPYELLFHFYNGMTGNLHSTQSGLDWNCCMNMSSNQWLTLQMWWHDEGLKVNICSLTKWNFSMSRFREVFLLRFYNILRANSNIWKWLEVTNISFTAFLLVSNYYSWDLKGLLSVVERPVTMRQMNLLMYEKVTALF